MTLSKKKSRSIEVDDIRFRYAISKSPGVPEGEFLLNLTVQIENGTGCILKVDHIPTRDVWLDFPVIESAEKYLVLTPGKVAAFIRRARANGWNPQQGGRAFYLLTAGEKSPKRKSTTVKM